MVRSGSVTDPDPTDPPLKDTNSSEYCLSPSLNLLEIFAPSDLVSAGLEEEELNAFTVQGQQE